MQVKLLIWISDPGYKGQWVKPKYFMVQEKLGKNAWTQNICRCKSINDYKSRFMQKGMNGLWGHQNIFMEFCTIIMIYLNSHETDWGKWGQLSQMFIPRVIPRCQWLRHWSLDWVELCKHITEAGTPSESYCKHNLLSQLYNPSANHR